MHGGGGLGGNSDLAIGNVLGSNLANIGLILGLTALVRPLDVAARVVWREVPLMILVTAALYPAGVGRRAGTGATASSCSWRWWAT